MKATLLLFTCVVVVCPGVSASERALKVYILAGQSNMQGHAQVRTFEHLGMDSRTAPLLKEMRDADGAPKTCDQVWISSIGHDGSEKERHGQLSADYGAAGRGPKIGPEYTFGIYMQKLVDEPILIIKTAWGGKSINTDFRPPSAGPYVFSEKQLENLRRQDRDIEKIKAEREAATGRYYALMINHVRTVLSDIGRVYPDYDPNSGYELAGFVWFQGWNDMVDGSTYPDRSSPGGYDQYSTVLAHFIRDVRNDLSAARHAVRDRRDGGGWPGRSVRPEPAEVQEYAQRVSQGDGCSGGHARVPGQRPGGADGELLGRRVGRAVGTVGQGECKAAEPE